MFNLMAAIIMVGCYSAPGTPACEYEKDRQEEWKEYQDERKEKYDRWDNQQRERTPYSTESPPPPYIG